MWSLNTFRLKRQWTCCKAILWRSLHIFVYFPSRSYFLLVCFSAFILVYIGKNCIKMKQKPSAKSKAVLTKLYISKINIYIHMYRFVNIIYLRSYIFLFYFKSKVFHLQILFAFFIHVMCIQMNI